MTLAELRRLVEEQNLDGQTVFAGSAQFTEWMRDMQAIERFTSAAVARAGYANLWSQWPGRPRALIVLSADLHPDESRVVKDWKPVPIDA